MPSAIVVPLGARPATGAHAADADDTELGPQRIECQGDAGREAAASDRDHDRSGSRRQLVDELQSECALTRDDPRIVERVDECRALVTLDRTGGGALAPNYTRSPLGRSMTLARTRWMSERVAHASGEPFRGPERLRSFRVSSDKLRALGWRPRYS